MWVIGVSQFRYIFVYFLLDKLHKYTKYYSCIMKKLSKHIHHIFYINLDKRRDRKMHMDTLMEEYNFHAERIPAIEYKGRGIVGCGYSHLKTLKLAKERGYKNILILEDDFMFMDISREYIERKINMMFEEVPNFDVCMFSYNLKESAPIGTTGEIIQIFYAHTASAYIVQQHYYDKLIALYEWAIPLLEQTGMHWVYANDVVWKDLQRDGLWIGPTPRLGKQMDGYSDNSERNVVYDC